MVNKSYAIQLAVLAVINGLVAADDVVDNNSEEVGTYTINDFVASVDSPFYVLNVLKFEMDDICIADIYVIGKEIKQNMMMPCEPHGFGTTYKTIKVEGTLMYGDPNGKFALYSDTPGNLVIIRPGNCEKIIYTTSDSGTKGVSMGVSDNECLAVKQKMTEKIEDSGDYDSGSVKVNSK